MILARAEAAKNIKNAAGQNKPVNVEKLKVKYFFLSILSGILFALSFQKINAFYLAWIAFIPLLFCLKKNHIFNSFVYGFTAGFICNAISLFWMLPFLNFNLGSVFQSVFVSCLLWIYLALYFSVWSVFVSFIKQNYSNCILIVFSCSVFWSVLEYLRTYLFSGFGWNLAGYSQASFLPVIQIADIFGVYAVSFLIIFFNMSIFFFVKYKNKKCLYYGLILFAVFLSYGIFKLNSVDVKSGKPVNVCIIQPNIDQYKKWDSRYFYEIIDSLKNISDMTKDENTDIAVYPETVLPGYFEINKNIRQLVKDISSNAELSLIGSPRMDVYGSVYNSVLAVGKTGEIKGIHDKNHLVLFGEFVPFQNFLSKYFGVLNTLGDFTKGKTMSVFKSEGISAGPVICSENFFPDLSVKSVNNGAEFLVNHTNDAWFFDSSAPYQHFVMNIFRSVENRKYNVVSANTGISAVIDSLGNVSEKTLLNTAAVITGIIYQNNIKTLYDISGDIFIYAGIVFLIVIFVIIFIK